VSVTGSRDFVVKSSYGLFLRQVSDLTHRWVESPGDATAWPSFVHAFTGAEKLGVDVEYSVHERRWRWLSNGQVGAYELWP
jgi:hypothetical protein